MSSSAVDNIIVKVCGEIDGTAIRLLCESIVEAGVPQEQLTIINSKFQAKMMDEMRRLSFDV